MSSSSPSFSSLSPSQRLIIQCFVSPVRSLSSLLTFFSDPDNCPQRLPLGPLLSIYRDLRESLDCLFAKLTTPRFNPPQSLLLPELPLLTSLLSDQLSDVQQATASFSANSWLSFSFISLPYKMNQWSQNARCALRKVKLLTIKTEGELEGQGVRIGVESVWNPVAVTFSSLVECGFFLNKEGNVGVASAQDEGGEVENGRGKRAVGGGIDSASTSELLDGGSGGRRGGKAIGTKGGKWREKMQGGRRGDVEGEMLGAEEAINILSDCTKGLEELCEICRRLGLRNDACMGKDLENILEGYSRIRIDVLFVQNLLMMPNFCVPRVVFENAVGEISKSLLKQKEKATEVDAMAIDPLMISFGVGKGIKQVRLEVAKTMGMANKLRGDVCNPLGKIGTMQCGDGNRRPMVPRGNAVEDPAMEAYTTYKVFLSHAGEDKETIALPLWQRLKDKGISAFADRVELKPGDAAPDAMITAMKTAPVGVMILSAEYVAKKWPMLECDCYLERRRKSVGSVIILPIFYRLDVNTCRDGRVFQKHAEVFTSFNYFDRAGKCETSVDKTLNSLRNLATHTGVLNPVTSRITNENTEKMKKLREEFVEKMADEIAKVVERWESQQKSGKR